MKLLHTADLHLDSAFCGTGPLGAEVRREGQRSLLKRIFDCATRECCDMILMAGDIFDTVFVTPETAELCVRLFTDFAKPVIVAPGNHDYLASGGFWSSAELPSNVYVFSSTELQLFDFPELGVSVAGYAFTSSVLSKNPLVEGNINRADTEKYMLLCAHADVDVPMSRYAAATLGDITRHGFDYAALGHVHMPPVLSQNIRYCGFAEGRAFDEIGEGQVLIVTIDDSGCTVEERIVSKVRYVRTELSVDGALTVEQTKSIMGAEIERYADKPTHLRIELVGSLSPDALPDLRALCENAGGSVASLEVIDSTLCLPNGEYLERDVTLRGELYRVLRPRLISDDLHERRIALKALNIGLAAIEGKNFTEGGMGE